MSYPIPVHLELKSPTGKLSVYQLKEKERVERSGSIFFVCRTPQELHEFFVSHGLDRIQMPNPIVQGKFTEAHLAKFVRDYLKLAERIYGIYWIRNQQGLGNNRGRSDFYFEMPHIETPA